MAAFLSSRKFGCRTGVWGSFLRGQDSTHVIGSCCGHDPTQDECRNEVHASLHESGSFRECTPYPALSAKL